VTRTIGTWIHYNGSQPRDPRSHTLEQRVDVAHAGALLARQELLAATFTAQRVEHNTEMFLADLAAWRMTDALAECGLSSAQDGIDVLNDTDAGVPFFTALDARRVA